MIRIEWQWYGINHYGVHLHSTFIQQTALSLHFLVVFLAVAHFIVRLVDVYIVIYEHKHINILTSMRG